MRLRHLLLATFLLVSTAYAVPVDTNALDFTTTIVGGGNTIVFPNVGGPSNYTYYTRINQIYAAPLYVYVNGGSIRQGTLIYNMNSGSNYQDVAFSIPASAVQPAVGAALYGPNIVGFVDGVGFYIFPGVYNLTDSLGNPYTYTVTQAGTSPVPEPAPFAIVTASLFCLLGIAGIRHIRAMPLGSSRL